MCTLHTLSFSLVLVSRIRDRCSHSLLRRVLSYCHHKVHRPWYPSGQWRAQGSHSDMSSEHVPVTHSWDRLRIAFVFLCVFCSVFYTFTQWKVCMSLWSEGKGKSGDAWTWRTRSWLRALLGKLPQTAQHLISLNPFCWLHSIFCFSLCLDPSCLCIPIKLIKTWTGNIKSPWNQTKPTARTLRALCNQNCVRLFSGNCEPNNSPGLRHSWKAQGTDMPLVWKQKGLWNCFCKKFFP